MKLWQKIYLVVLTVAVLFSNIGIYAVFQLTYQKGIDTEQRRSEVDYGILCRSVQQKMQAMERQKRLTEDAAADLMAICESDYKKRNLTIKLWKNKKQIYPKGSGEIPYAVEEGHARIEISGKKQQKNLIAAGELTGLSDSYLLYIEYPLEELNTTWGQLNRIYIFISLGISVVLTIVLSVFLAFLLRPLKTLTEQVTDIRQGNYESRVQIGGRDELAGLGENINVMAETIADNINRLNEDNRKKEQLVDNLAHEMKSPLTSIYGFAEYLMKGRIEPEEAIECYSFIMEESQRMKDMCYALMDLSEMRHKEIEFEKFFADSFVRQMREMTDRRQSSLTGQDDVVIDWDCKNVLGAKLYGNAELLGMLVWNLISNAIHACRQRDRENLSSLTGPDVMVSMEKLSDNGHTFSIRVKDRGIGMPEEETLHITEPFYRVDKGRSRERGGNGLGLALCQQIVLLHQGRMVVQSEKGCGTEITVFLWENEM